MITIEKAIETLRDTESTYHHQRWEQYIEAVRLGIAGLQRIQEWRNQGVVAKMNTLQGETRVKERR